MSDSKQQTAATEISEVEVSANTDAPKNLPSKKRRSSEKQVSVVEGPEVESPANENTVAIPPPPPMEKTLGSKTPAYREWLIAYNPPRELIDKYLKESGI